MENDNITRYREAERHLARVTFLDNHAKLFHGWSAFFSARADGDTYREGQALEDWATRKSRQLHWTPPAAGAICFFSYQYPMDSMPLVDRLIRDYSTMVVPGVHFKTERHLRIGFGGPPHVLAAGLAALDRLLATIGD